MNFSLLAKWVLRNDLHGSIIRGFIKTYERPILNVEKVTNEHAYVYAQ